MDSSRIASHLLKNAIIPTLREFGVPLPASDWIDTGRLRVILSEIHQDKILTAKQCLEKFSKLIYAGSESINSIPSIVLIKEERYRTHERFNSTLKLRIVSTYAQFIDIVDERQIKDCIDKANALRLEISKEIRNAHYVPSSKK